MSDFTRRSFFKNTGLALAAFGLGPSFLSRALAETRGGGKKVLVVVFQRGGCDGLSLVPPVGDPAYYEVRHSIALPRPGEPQGALALDDHFGLHPSLAPLLPLWKSGMLSVVHGVGMPKPTRSHFDAQDYIDTGTPGTKSTPDGWLNRALEAEPRKGQNAFRAVAMEPTLPRSLLGNAPALSVGSLADFRIRAPGNKDPNAQGGFESLYASAVDEALRSTGAEAFAAMKTVQSAKLEAMPPQNGASYGNDPFGKHLQDIARLIRADVGLEIATTDVGGWDTHVGQGASDGQLSNRLKPYAQGLAAFAQDLGPRMKDVCVLTITEFGRTVKENGNRGTDHGTGSLMFAFGGNVKGGQVLGRVPDLREDQLFEGRDVPVAVDFRDAFSLALTEHLGVSDVGRVFPGYTPAGNLKLFT